MAVMPSVQLQRVLWITSLVRCGDSTSPHATVQDGSSYEVNDAGVVEKDGRTCTCTAPVVEVCNGVDDDCDCSIDEDVTGVSERCGIDEGECKSGRTACVVGEVVCPECEPGTPTPDCAILPVPEICDSLDNDCDGGTDEYFDFCGIEHCGSCAACAVEHAVQGCDASSCAGDCLGCATCVVLACEPGWRDCQVDDPADDCACECAVVTGAEVCDGQDNDCDGLTDADDGDLETAPGCPQSGECGGAVSQCRDTDPGPGVDVRWCCLYGPDVETDPGDACAVAAVESRCDARDGNCDGMTDESFPLGQPCDDGQMGLCRGTGVYQCRSDETDVECPVTMPGTTPADELCNGTDDDCDGAMDENTNGPAPGILGVCDDVQRVQRDGLDFYIYRFEASRPDATAAVVGTLGNRACSTATVLPWPSVNWFEAVAACTAVGMRLCTAAEWLAACETPPTTTIYPYADTYDPTACNGAQYDPVCPGPGDDCPVPTGSIGTCTSEDAIYDLSGNLQEWTNEMTAMGYQARGGAFDDLSASLACDFSLPSYDPSFLFPYLGFRCCCTTGAGCPPNPLCP